MVQMSEIQSEARYKGTTLEKVLLAICDANTTIALTSTALLKRLNVLLDQLEKINAEQQRHMLQDATSATIFGCLEGATQMGSAAVSLIKPSDPQAPAATAIARVFDRIRSPDSLKWIESSSKGAAPAFQGLGRASSSVNQSRLTDDQFGNNAANRNVNNVQETNSRLHGQQTELLQAGNTLLQSQSRANG